MLLTDQGFLSRKATWQTIVDVDGQGSELLDDSFNLIREEPQTQDLQDFQSSREQLSQFGDDGAQMLFE